MAMNGIKYTSLAKMKTLVSTTLLESCLNVKVVYFRLVRILIEHSQKRIQMFDFFAFSKGHTGGSEKL